MAATLPAKPGKVMKLMECPRDVLERVISFLPVPDMFRLTTVCKEWNEIITTRAFRENGQLRFNKLQLLAVCNSDSSSNNREFKAYDVDAQKWRSFDLSFLPGDGPFRVVDFAGCLACVMHERRMERVVLYVCNPLTKSLAGLPSPPFSFDPAASPNVTVRMYYCRKTGHYKVFVVSGLCPNRSGLFSRLAVEEFDSCSWTWAVHSQICRPFNWREMMEAGVLPSNSENGASLFILLYQTHGRNPNRRQLFALLFDDEKGDLGFVKIEAELPSNLLNPRLVCCERNPRPLLVSAAANPNGARGVRIWEWDNKLRKWIMLETMPYALFIYLKSLSSKGVVEREEVIGGRMVVMLGPPPSSILGFFPANVVAVAYKHLLYIRPQNVMSWSIAFDTRTRFWHLLSTKLLPPHEIGILNISPVITVSSCVRECAFEPSLENVVHGPHQVFHSSTRTCLLS